MLLVIGFIGLGENQPQVYNCEANGCDPQILSQIRSQVFWYTISLYSFYSGIALILAGIALLFVGWRLKPEVVPIPVRTLSRIELFLSCATLRGRLIFEGFGFRG